MTLLMDQARRWFEKRHGNMPIRRLPLEYQLAWFFMAVTLLGLSVLGGRR